MQQSLTLAQKERIYTGKLAGGTLAELAEEIGYSMTCVRKWWRKGRDKGLMGLRTPRRGRGKSGCLSGFDAVVAEKALEYKRSHTKWGPHRVLIELGHNQRLEGLRLPSRTRLADFFKERCPECVAARRTKTERINPLPKPQAAHEIWQLDCQENIRLTDGEIATICNLRDPVGAAMIASQAFSVKTSARWRKLAWTEYRSVLREAFTEWQTLPDGVQTDNELGMAGTPTDPYPGQLTLWLVGLGVRHRMIRPAHPTDQPHIERNHRTLDDLALNEEGLCNLLHLQTALDRERRIYNTCFPSQASDCQGRPPLVAHPELLRPRRCYAPQYELDLFNLQWVFDYLAGLTFVRQVSSAGRISLGSCEYSVGKPLYRILKQLGEPLVLVRLDPVQKEWVVYAKPSLEETPTKELARCLVKNLDVATLTGLSPQPLPIEQPIQLTLPCFVA
jgi:transposase InsO family protein